MIHSRPSPGTMDAYEDILEILSSAKEKYGDDLRGNIHFLSGLKRSRDSFLTLDSLFHLPE